MKISALILGLALTAGVAVTVEPAAARPKKEDEAAKGPKLTPAVQNALSAAQTALKAGDTATATAKLAEADAVQNRTANDNYFLGVTRATVGQKLQNDAMTKQGLDEALASGQADTGQQFQFNAILANMALKANDRVSAYKYLTAAQRIKPEDPEIARTIALLAYENKNMAPADRMAAVKNAIEISQKDGTKADEQLYLRQLQLAVDTKSTANVVPAAIELLKAYPSSRNWEYAAAFYRDAYRPNAEIDLDLYRLQSANDAVQGQSQYLDYAQIAQQRGLPGEVRRALDGGVRKGMVQQGSATYQDLNRAATPAKIAGDKAQLPKLEAQSRTSPSGRLAAATASAYLGYGDYAKAAALYRLALQKGGVDADTINTRLGYALAMSGDKAGAQAAFQAVQGQPRAQLAQYYQAWLAQKA